MSIRVQCPNGHIFRVKDKYAGKKGLCPHCDGEVVVKVPKLTDEVPSGSAPAPKKGQKPYVIDEHDTTLVYEDPLSEETSDTGHSLVGESAIQHGKKCAKCGAKSPIWYASCQKCGEFFKDI